MNKSIHKKGSMGKSHIISLFIVVMLLFCVSCESNKPLPDSGVTILSPKANDVIKAGDSYALLWKADLAELGAMVTVEFSKDGGKSWETIEENVANKGNYMWKAPKVDSTQCKVRIFPSIDRNIVGLQKCSP